MRVRLGIDVDDIVDYVESGESLFSFSLASW